MWFSIIILNLLKRIFLLLSRDYIDALLIALDQDKIPDTNTRCRTRSGTAD